MIRDVLLTCMLAQVAGCGGAVELPGAAVDGGRDASAVAPPPTTSPPPVDAGASTPDATAPGPDLTSFPELADCLPSAYELPATTTGGSVFPAGVFGIDGTKGNWSGMVTTQTIMQLDIAPGWTFTWNDHDSFLKPGTYVVGARDPGVGVSVDGRGCGGQPGDTFTVVAYASSGGDQASLTRLAAFFDLTCERSGRLRGCVRYGH